MLTTSSAITYGLAFSASGLSTPYVLRFRGYDFDGAHEVTVAVNGIRIGQFPPIDSPQNAGVFATFAHNVTSIDNNGINTITFTHANWDVFIPDYVKNLTVTSPTGNVVYSNSTAYATLPNPLSYSFSLATPPTTPSIGAIAFNVSSFRPVEYGFQNGTLINGPALGLFGATFTSTLFNASWSNFYVFWALNYTVHSGSPVSKLNVTYLQWTVIFQNRTTVGSTLGLLNQTRAGPVWGFGPFNMTVNRPEQITLDMTFIPNAIPSAKYVLLIWAQQSNVPVIPNMPNGSAVTIG